MFVYSVQDEYFGIINASARAICKLEWVDQRVCFSDDVLFYNSLHCFHHEGGEGHRSEVVEYFVLLLLGFFLYFLFVFQLGCFNGMLNFFVDLFLLRFGENYPIFLLRIC